MTVQSLTSRFIQQVRSHNEPPIVLITMAASMATDLRPMYKKLMRLAKSLAEPKRQSTIDQIRTEFRTQRDVSDPKECAH